MSEFFPEHFHIGYVSKGRRDVSKLRGIGFGWVFLKNEV